MAGDLRQEEGPTVGSALQYAFDHCGEVHEQMESIGDLLCLWRAQGGAFGVQTATITRDGHDLPDVAGATPRGSPRIDQAADPLPDGGPS